MVSVASSAGVPLCGLICRQECFLFNTEKRILLFPFLPFRPLLPLHRSGALFQMKRFFFSSFCSRTGSTKQPSFFHNHLPVAHRRYKVFKLYCKFFGFYSGEPAGDFRSLELSDWPATLQHNLYTTRCLSTR